jgi:hypothetical protein
MGVFFFNLRNSTGYLEDEEGEDLPDLGAAREAALDSVRSIISEESKQGLIDLRGSIEVTDEAGRLVLELPFGEAVDIKTGPPPPSDEAAGAAR